MRIHAPMEMIGRFIQLLVGLALYGLAVAAMARADLGLGPWDVLHQGITHRIGISLGSAVILTSIAVLALRLPLRQRPGIGTLINMSDGAGEMVTVDEGVTEYRIGGAVMSTFFRDWQDGAPIDNGMEQVPDDGIDGQER